MRNLGMLLVFVFLSINVQSQTENYPQGLYMNLQEVLDKKPSAALKVELEQRSPGKIKMNGGNDYQINSDDKTVKRSFLLKEVFAYSEGSHLYLNCLNFELQTWYAKVEGENGNYFFFKAGIPMNPKRYGYKSSDLSNMFGAIGGAFGGAKMAMARLPYLLDKNSGEAVLVSHKNIGNYIGSSPRLSDAYENEPEKESLEVISGYLLKWIQNDQTD